MRAPGPAHPGNRMFRAEESTLQIHVEGAIPDARRHSHRAPLHINAGIVHENVKFAERRDNPLHRRLDLVLVRHIALNGQRAPRLAKLLLHAQSSLAVNVEDDDDGPRLRKSLRNPGADA